MKPSQAIKSAPPAPPVRLAQRVAVSLLLAWLPPFSAPLPCSAADAAKGAGLPLPTPTTTPTTTTVPATRPPPPTPIVPSAPAQPVTIHSQSGQFVVRGLPQPMATSTVGMTSAVPYLRLDPNLTAVSLERIRQALSSELGWPNRWQSMISVTTYPLQGEDARVTVGTLRFPSGWGYRLIFPEIIDKDRFVSAAIKTLLIEYANRRATFREAEVPLWVSEGLTAELMATSLPVLALESATEINRRGETPDPLAEARRRLREREPFNFDDLSMPSNLTEADMGHFRACAQVFVHELLRLKDGRNCLRRMLERLPDNYNWQTTFLEEFGFHFKSLLDVDQWYALAVTGTQARDRTALLSTAATQQQLDAILDTLVEVRVEAQDLPIRTGIKLQRIVAEWPYPRQHAVLVDKIGRLQTLQGRAAPELAGVINSYLEALLQYVGPKNLVVPTRPTAIDRLRPKGDIRLLQQQLDRLESRRVDLVTKGSR